MIRRNIEPKYGFFILNRVGTEDFVQYIIPSDKITPQGQYLCIESKESHGTSTADSGYEAPHSDRLQSTMSLWTLPTDTRESLADVMLRLLDCVSRGVPYPQEYRFGPDILVRSTFVSNSGNEDEDNYESESGDEVYHDAMSVSASTNSVVRQALHEAGGTSNTQPEPGVSGLDHLFAKLAASASLHDLFPPFENDPPSQTVQPSTTANSILEVLSRSNQPPAAPQGPLSGQALLNNMFASVASSTGQSSQRPLLPADNNAQFRFPSHTSTVSSPPQDMEILSPKPNNAALPQILTADVIHELMGFPSSSSRSTSRISTSNSEQSQSASSVQPQAQNVTRPRTPSSAGAPRSKERGYIADRGEDDGGVSEASTGMEGEMVVDRQHTQDRGLGSRTLGARSSFLSATNTGSNGSLKGDTTPRAQQGRGLESMPSHLSLNSQKSGRAMLSQSVSDALVAGPSTKGGQAFPSRTVPAPVPAPERAPFMADSELWPQTQASRTSGKEDKHNGKVEDFDGIMELDFSEIRVLDDPQAFETNGAGGHGKEKGKGRDKDRARREPTSRPKDKEKDKTNYSQGSGPVSSSAIERDRQRGKSSRREKERLAGTATPANESIVFTEITTPPRNLTNGNSSSSISTIKRSAQSPLTSSVAPDLAKGILLNEISRSGASSVGPVLDKNTFMQQVLTLIHVSHSPFLPCSIFENIAV